MGSKSFEPTLKPLLIGMGLGVNGNPTAAGTMLRSLFGHMVYGLILGISFAKLAVHRGTQLRPRATSTTR